MLHILFRALSHSPIGHVPRVQRLLNFRWITYCVSLFSCVNIKFNMMHQINVRSVLSFLKGFKERPPDGFSVILEATPDAFCFVCFEFMNQFSCFYTRAHNLWVQYWDNYHFSGYTNGLSGKFFYHFTFFCYHEGPWMMELFVNNQNEEPNGKQCHVGLTASHIRTVFCM